MTTRLILHAESPLEAHVMGIISKYAFDSSDQELGFEGSRWFDHDGTTYILIRNKNSWTIRRAG